MKEILITHHATGKEQIKLLLINKWISLRMTLKLLINLVNNLESVFQPHERIMIGQLSHLLPQAWMRHIWIKTFLQYFLRRILTVPIILKNPELKLWCFIHCTTTLATSSGLPSILITCWWRWLDLTIGRGKLFPRFDVFSARRHKDLFFDYSDDRVRYGNLVSARGHETRPQPTLIVFHLRRVDFALRGRVADHLIFGALRVALAHLLHVLVDFHLDCFFNYDLSFFKPLLRCQLHVEPNVYKFSLETSVDSRCEL